MLPISSSNVVQGEQPVPSHGVSHAPSASHCRTARATVPTQVDGLVREPVYPESAHGPAAPLVAREDIEPKHLMILMLDELEVPINKTKVPPPPMVSFASDVDRIPVEWCKSRLLMINGIGIPIKDWVKLYQKKYKLQQNAWQRIKNQWGRWGFIAKEFERLGSNDAFWEKFSNEDGTRMNYEKILNVLKAEREAHAIKHAADARRFFGNDLTRADTDRAFYFRNGKGWQVTKSDSGIVSKWLELLEENEDIAARWKDMQDEEGQPAEEDGAEPMDVGPDGSE
ncbi:hypothetical protein EUX98_g9396 [Antrodiella citrinella]|uniref:Uncharacterized protein n=1 Tax=Antrodiella citrinella TaxID=2447956 RepID=A0A4S4LVX7_9APHY|nr:hypothetical protein EUX98_g9396 [Antrodiella citrinella]